MAELLVAYDNFDGPWSTDRVFTTSGARWNTANGRLGCDGAGHGVATSMPIGAVVATPSLGTPGPDHAIEIRGVSSTFGVYVRGLGGNVVTNSYFVYGYSGAIYIYRGTGSDAGTNSVVGTSVGSYTTGDTIRVKAVGTTLTIYQNGTLISTTTINASTNTEVGLYWSTTRTTPGTAMFADLKVYSYAPGPVALQGTAPGTSQVGFYAALDSNRTGIFYRMGGDGASNPYTSGAVGLSASSIYSPTWDVDRLVDRATTYPCHTNNLANSWFAADLKTTTLIPTWVAIRQRADNSAHQAVSIVFEASNDGTNWTTITTITMTSGTGVWTDTNVTVAQAYRYFRIRHPGQTSTAGYYYFVLSEWEIGGYTSGVSMSIQGPDLSGTATGAATATGTIRSTCTLAGSADGAAGTQVQTLYTGQSVAPTGIGSTLNLPNLFTTRRVGQFALIDPAANPPTPGSMSVVTAEPCVTPRSSKLHATYDGRPANA